MTELNNVDIALLFPLLRSRRGQWIEAAPPQVQLFGPGKLAAPRAAAVGADLIGVAAGPGPQQLADFRRRSSLRTNAEHDGSGERGQTRACGNDHTMQ